MSLAHLPPGAVVDVELGKPPATTGHEIQKRRPCVVLVHMPPLGLLMVVPVSKGKPKVMGYTNVALQPSAANGLADPCFAQCHQLRTVDAQRVKKVRGRLTAYDLSMVKMTLQRLLGLAA